jgi:tRNA threonylcarbamoyladenosine biosynthesis protein TsaE
MRGRNPATGVAGGREAAGVAGLAERSAARTLRSERALTLAELEAWGEALGREAGAPTIVAIAGDLGAGKTTLVQAICRGFGVREQVTSPTFALVHEYHGERGAVYHLDLYRLSDASQLTNLAWDDIVNRDALVLIEWPERAGSRLPADAIRLELAHIPGDEGRRLLARRG